jgi:hypothetical protein
MKAKGLHLNDVIGRIIYQEPGDCPILPKILSYSSLADAPSISRACKIFNRIVNKERMTAEPIWRNFAISTDPEIGRIYPLCNESTLDNPCGGWKALLQRTKSYNLQCKGKYAKVMKSLELVFRPEGVLPYFCYGPDLRHIHSPWWINGGFRQSVRGINKFSASLNENGLQLLHTAPGILFVYYNDYDYLMDKWEDQCDIIRRWFSVWGLGREKYTIKEPEAGSNRSWGAINVELNCDLNDVDLNTLCHPVPNYSVIWRQNNL